MLPTISLTSTITSVYDHVDLAIEDADKAYDRLSLAKRNLADAERDYKDVVTVLADLRKAAEVLTEARKRKSLIGSRNPARFR